MWPWSSYRGRHVAVDPPVPREITPADLFTDEFDHESRHRAMQALDDSAESVRRVSRLAEPVKELTDSISKKREANHWAEALVETMRPDRPERQRQ